MIYLLKDMSQVEHIIIYDNTTPIGIMRIPFKLDKCADIQDWYYWVEKYLHVWAKEHKYSLEQIHAKAVLMYNAEDYRP